MLFHLKYDYALSKFALPSFGTNKILDISSCKHFKPPPLHNLTSHFNKEIKCSTMVDNSFLPITLFTTYLLCEKNSRNRIMHFNFMTNLTTPHREGQEILCHLNYKLNMPYIENKRRNHSKWTLTPWIMKFCIHHIYM